jgi:small subunit ribosomal protein S1
MFVFSSPSTPLEEEYWDALMRDGENSQLTAPPIPLDERWRGLGSSVPEIKPITQEPALDGFWETAIEVMNAETVLELPVVGYNRGGVLVSWNGTQGFVPASHLADLSAYLDEREREAAMEETVGQTLCLKVIEVDPDRSRLILSERATRSDEENRQELLQQLIPGSIRQGKVTNLCSFGAFVDLGGVEGLVHISEISWGRVNHPSDVLTPGQELKVYVLNVDNDRGRVGLSLKRAQPDPWENLEERYHPGQVVEAVVTNVVDFGAFAEVEEGVEGLIHVSELAEGKFVHPNNVVQEGDKVYARVLNVSSSRRRLGLSLRQVPIDNQS